jgi:hypothetical protein
MKLSPEVAKQMGKKTAMMGSEVNSPGIFPINMVEPHSRLQKGGYVKSNVGYANCGASVKPAQKRKN